ncbi:hypothetical protein BZG29_18345 [Janthinobacterium sp. LM6]|nr:hypothetical protein BZG29_18345 [Janthinobacterium sp. LM6]
MPAAAAMAQSARQAGTASPKPARHCYHRALISIGGSMSDLVQHALAHAGKPATTPWVVTLISGEKLTGPISPLSDGCYAIGLGQIKYFSSDKVACLNVSGAGAFPI